MPAQQLLKRTFDFAVSVGKAVNVLPFNASNKNIIDQLCRCSSSVGANFRAAQRAKSVKDFLFKLKIVEEEADESIYFLDLIIELNPHKASYFLPLKAEAIEILKIIVASIQKVRSRNKEA